MKWLVHFNFYARFFSHLPSLSLLLVTSSANDWCYLEPNVHLLISPFLLRLTLFKEERAIACERKIDTKSTLDGKVVTQTDFTTERSFSLSALTINKKSYCEKICTVSVSSPPLPMYGKQQHRYCSSCKVRKEMRSVANCSCCQK